jgi:hypothetical protein
VCSVASRQNTVRHQYISFTLSIFSTRNSKVLSSFDGYEMALQGVTLLLRLACRMALQGVTAAGL